ncbi:hypothetical protein DSO57_1004370, partial [Entomophthora muscae]
MAAYKTNLQKYMDVAIRKVHPKPGEDISEFLANSLKFTLVNGELFRKTDSGLKMVPTKDKRVAILKEAHDRNRNFGQHATVERLKATYR